MFGFIVGSGFYDQEGFTAETVSTSYGDAEVLRGQLNGSEVIILPRHGANHKYLPHHIPFKAHMTALKELGCDKIVSFSVCGMLNAGLPLAKPCLVTDLLYSDNRLPDGSMCSLFDEPGKPGRGHLIAESFFNSQLCELIKQLHEDISNVNYIYSAGPRFNSKVEIRAWRDQGADVISQTCGPEAVLANELEIPYALVVFPIDYANGVQIESTSMEELGANMAQSKPAFVDIMSHLVDNERDISFEGFVYRFE